MLATDLLEPRSILLTSSERSTDSAQSLDEHKCIFTLVLAQVRVAAREREPIRLTNRRRDNNRQGKIEVAHHRLNQRCLLEVLSAEDCDVGLHDVKQLCDNCKNSVEMAGPHLALPHRSRNAGAHCRGAPVRVHLLRRRREQNVYSCLGSETSVLFEWTRVTSEIFARAELQRVDENAHHDAVGSLSRALDETQMTAVKRTHRRDEADADALSAHAFERSAHIGNARNAERASYCVRHRGTQSNALPPRTLQQRRVTPEQDPRSA